MRKIIFTIVALLLVCILGTPVTYAHFSNSNNNVGLRIHIAPDDDPIAGQPSEMTIYFQDNNKLLTTENCACALAISSDGQLRSVIPFTLLDQEPLRYTTTYTFVEKGIYTLRVLGTIHGTKNVAFDTSLDVRVEKSVIPEKKTLSAKERGDIFIVIALASVFGFAVIIYLTKRV